MGETTDRAGQDGRTCWLLRHGERQDQADPAWAETAANPHDPGLTEWGHEQADRAGRRLREEGVGAVYASPFTRAVETAVAVAAHLDLPVFVEDGLCEHLNPDWFPHAPRAPRPGEHARRHDRVDASHDSVLVPGYPESGEAAAARAAETARRLLAADDRTLLLVGHGLTVGGVADGLTGEGVEAPLAGLTRLVETDGDWRVALAADTSHYEE
jgi:broad specificity phosphatase PhoE